MQNFLNDHQLILMEAAVIEMLRRSENITLHPYLENSLLIYEEKGKEALSALYRSFIQIAHDAEVPITVCTPTWRASKDRISAAHITSDINGDAVNFLAQLRSQWKPWDANILIGGLIGCKNDCYKPEEGLSQSEAKTFHRWQITRLAVKGVDFLLAATLPALSEATGIALAMAETGIPFVISFVIDKKGRVLDGNSLENCFKTIDATCSRPPLGYMINCAYPSFLNPDSQPPSVLSRLIGYQANGSSLDHRQLDGSVNLQADDVSDWGNLMITLNRKYGVKILGGCCGTNFRHLRYITNNM